MILATFHSQSTAAVVCSINGCTLFDFLAEARGIDRGTSVDYRGCCHGLPWKSAGSRQLPRVMALPRQMPRLWPRHVATVLSVADSIVSTMATHGNPRKLQWQFPRPSAAIVTATRQSPWKSMAIATAVSADVQSKQFPRPSVRVHCNGNRPIRGDFHGSLWESAAIATARAAVLSVANSAVPIMPTATAVRPRGSESCRGYCRGDCRGPRRGDCRGNCHG